MPILVQHWPMFHSNIGPMSWPILIQHWVEILDQYPVLLGIRSSTQCHRLLIMPPPLIGGGIKWWCCLTSVCLSVAYIGRKSRTERSRKTRIGREVAHVTRDSDITFKVKGQGHQAALLTAALTREARAAVTVRKYSAWESRPTATLRLLGGARGARAATGGGEERGHIVSRSPRVQLAICDHLRTLHRFQRYVIWRNWSRNSNLSYLIRI